MNQESSPRSSDAQSLKPSPEMYGWLRKYDFFGLFSSDEYLNKVIEMGTWAKYPTGTLIIKEGEFDDSIYIVIKGRVRVFKNKKTLDVLEDGDMFGELGALLNLSRSANVVTVNDTWLYRGSVDMLKNMPADMLFPIMRLFFQVTARRLIQADRKLAAV